MTRDEILAMEPGREMDAVVAEAMGYQVSWWSLMPAEHKGDFNEWRPAMYGDSEIYAPAKYGDMPGKEMLRYGRWVGIPHYSTDISAAWPLIEEARTAPGMGGCKACVEVHSTDSKYTDTPYWALIHGHMGEGKNAPEAICKAYLLWRESENERD